MSADEEIDLLKAAKHGYQAKAEACQQRIDDLNGDVKPKRGRPFGSVSKAAPEETAEG